VRRAFVAAVVGLVVLGTSVAPGAAEPSSLDASFHGSSVMTAGCTYIRQTYAARYTDHAGHVGHFSLDGCMTFADTTTFDGTFVLRPKGGPRARGTATGVIAPSTAACSGGLTPWDLDFTLTPSVGSPIQLVGLWCSSGAFDAPEPIRGTITQP
jgi:hypothetical protein